MEGRLSHQSGIDTCASTVQRECVGEEANSADYVVHGVIITVNTAEQSLFKVKCVF